MLEKILNSKTQTLINKAMDASSLKNDVIANNIANVDTPKFKRSEVIFEEKIKKVLDNQTNYAKLNLTNNRHIQINETENYQDIQPEIRNMEDLSYRNDQNNVDVDVEMAKMTKNKIYYDSVSQSMSNEIRLLRLAITGRR